MISLSRTRGIAATLIVAFALAPSSLSQSQSSQVQDPTCSVAGRVMIGELPARGIAVLLVSPRSGLMERPIGRATTDGDGRFQITGVPAGQYLLQAFAPAYIAPSDNRVGRAGKIINLTAGESVEGMDIGLSRGAAITGRVTDASGQPIIQENVRLFAADQQGRKAQIYLPYGFMSATDDRGVYRLFGVPPGRYILAVGVDTNAPNVRMNSGTTYYPLTYHPDVTDESKAAVIEVTGGGEAAGVDVVIGRVKGYSVSGRIIDAQTGRPVVGMMYGYGVLDGEGGQLISMGYTSSTSNARGEFLFEGVAPGRYAAFASPANDSDTYSETAPFTVRDSDVSGLVVKIHNSGSSIIGTVVVEGAEGQPGAPRVTDVRFGVFSGSVNAARRFIPVVVAPDGSFRAAGLPPGMASFSISYPSAKGLQLARIERDAIEAKSGIEVGLNEEISGVRVVFAYGTGTVRGQVKVEGGELAADTMMFLNIRRSGGNPPPIMNPPIPDSRGRFVIEGLLPGDYELDLRFITKPVSPDGRLMTSKAVNQKVTVTNGKETQVTMIVDLNSSDR